MIEESFLPAFKTIKRNSSLYQARIGKVEAWVALLSGLDDERKVEKFDKDLFY